uniref:Bactericidal permeability-increasing protein n=1 Tax=Neogobius melanostomus TaxID=47308 RepID=A0A8C6UHN5_9GOBI
MLQPTPFELFFCDEMFNYCENMNVNSSNKQLNQYPMICFFRGDTFEYLYLNIVKYKTTKNLCMQIAKVDLPEPSVHFSPNVSGLDLSVSGLCVAVTGDWETHLGFIHDGGTFDMAVFDLSLRSVLTVNRDSGGRLSVFSVSCEADIESVDLRFYGGASLTYTNNNKQNTNNNKQNNNKGHCLPQICPPVEDAIQCLEQHLQAMEGITASSFNNTSTDSNRWCSSSKYVNQRVLQGSSEASRPATPFWPAFSIPVPRRMCFVGCVRVHANSASFAYYDSGHLQAFINDSMVPPFCPVRLNTSSMGRYIPQLPKLFPNLLMELQVYARQIPLFSFEPDFVKLNLPSGVKAFAVLPNATLTPLFKLKLAKNFLHALHARSHFRVQGVKESIHFLDSCLNGELLLSCMVTLPSCALVIMVNTTCRVENCT